MPVKSRFFVSLIIVGLFLLIGGWQQLNNKFGPASPTPAAAEKVLAGNIAAGCHAVNGLPDPGCTPGTTNSEVTQDTVDFTICTRGYTKTVRPPVEYTDKLKVELMVKYGMTDSPANYELDHLIPLELGGNPTSAQNLWPEAYSPAPGAHEKDKVENYLNRQVCHGMISLEEAQKEIAESWMKVYEKIAGGY